MHTKLLVWFVFISLLPHTGSKTAILSRNVDQKSLETEFLIAIFRHTGNKWQSKTLFLSIFDPRSSIVDSVFDCRLPGVLPYCSSGKAFHEQFTRTQLQYTFQRGSIHFKGVAWGWGKGAWGGK